MPVFIKAATAFAKKVLKKLAKEWAKQKARDVAEEFGIVKGVMITLLAFVIAIPLFMFGMFGNLMCTVLKCEDNTGKVEDVISISMLKEISSRMENMRMEANSDANIPGENYGRYKIKLFSNDGEDSKDTDPKEQLEENAENKTSFPTADHNVWVTGAKDNVNEGLLNRLAAVGQHYNKKVNIYSGWRSYQEQKELYDGFNAGKPGYNLAANPMFDTHVMGLAVDVDGWLKTDVPSSALAQFGLAKEIDGEPWHIWKKGMYYIPREQRMYVDYDGYKVPQGLIDSMLNGTPAPANVGSTGSSSGGDSEAYIHLLALGQADELEISFYNKEDLDHEEEKGTNLGKTWTLAKEIKKEIKAGTYKDSELVKRSKEENWTTRQYMKLARWEIQKCFLVGDAGFWEGLIGGPKPCSEIKRMTGEDIVPEKLQGVVAKTKESNEQTEVVYKDVQEILYMYKDISLFKNKEEFKPVMKEILENLYDRQAAPSVLSNGVLSAPNFITPLEQGTYEIEQRYGTKLENNELSKGIIFTVPRTTPIYASISGKVEAVYDESGIKTVLISHPTYGFVEYKGLNEVLVTKGNNVQQGQLIGAVGPTIPLEFRTCMQASIDLPLPTCTNSTDPESGEVKLVVTSGIDEEKSKDRETKYQTWKTNPTSVLMPGFNPLTSLGQLSKKYESGGDPGICVHNPGDAGGLSCGSYQIANDVGTMDNFLGYLKTNYPKYYTQLASVPRTLSAFGPAWRSVYNSDPTGFYNAQHDFIGATHYIPEVNKLKKTWGFDPNTRSRAVMDMIWSYSVQHRNNTQVAFSASVGSNWANMSDREIVTAMYDYRINRWTSCCGKRFVNEKNDALALLTSLGL